MFNAAKSSASEDAKGIVPPSVNTQTMPKHAFYNNVSNPVREAHLRQSQIVKSAGVSDYTKRKLQAKGAALDASDIRAPRY